jgi:hypothetical protein
MLLALAVPLTPLRAQYATRRVNLPYLTQRADVIVQGRVARVAHAPLPGYPNIPTVEVTLEVESMLRGPGGGTYTFREIYLGLRAREGKQGYREGQRLLLFLPAPSRYGLSSPVGIEQGRFHITSGSDGSEIVVNEMDNAGLFRDSAAAARGAGLTEKERRLLGVGRGPVRLGEMLPVVRAFTALPRIP